MIKKNTIKLKEIYDDKYISMTKLPNNNLSMIKLIANGKTSNEAWNIVYKAKREYAMK